MQINVADTVHPPVRTGNPEPTLRLAVILTCFNRKQKTLDCLHALAANADLQGVQVSAVLTDDASKDGTADAVRTLFPWVQLLDGDGNLFWCRGMHKAFDVALQENYDYYLWLNDDTILAPDALSRLLHAARQPGKPVIIVGSTVDPETGELTYGGLARSSRLRPVNFHYVMPSDKPQRCDSMTGNIVLIPAAIARAVGNLDPVFEHAMGDTDYALRAGKLGFETWLGPGIYGTCSENPVAGTYYDGTQDFASQWRQMMSRKGLPWRSWFVLTRRHAGPLWILYFLWPYLNLILNRYGRLRVWKSRILP